MIKGVLGSLSRIGSVYRCLKDRF